MSVRFIPKAQEGWRQNFFYVSFLPNFHLFFKSGVEEEAEMLHLCL